MARRASAGGDHPWPAWFQDSVQHAQLLTNRTLRTYLLAHGADSWPEVVKATLLYGVLCLRRDFPGQPVLPLEQLQEAARALHAEAAMREALPRIRSQFEALEADVGGFLVELHQNGGAADRRSGGAGGMQQPDKKQQPAARHNARSSARPAGGTATSAIPSAASVALPAAAPRPPKPRQPAIYPDWWPKDGSGPAATARRASASGAARQRPQPRLAYSRPPSAPTSVTRDDLPTAAFLLVPPRVSSSRGSPPQKAGATAPQQAESRVALQHAQHLALQREQRRRQQQQQQQQQHGGGQGQEEAQAGAWLGDRSGGGYGAGRAHSTTVPAAPPGDAGLGRLPSPCDAEAAAKWMRHFGLQALRTAAEPCSP